jgi:thiopeptide-type bacteriocin biosynthesis protein
MADSAAAAWISVHAFYHGDLDRLLLDVVKPLTGDFFFLRYWDGGPHVRLRIRPAGGADPDDVSRLVLDRFLEFFRRHPSPDRLPPDLYASLAASLASWERVTSYSPRPCPNNSVALVAYRREYDRYGSGPAMDAVERHFVESSRIALPVLATAPPRRRIVAAAAAILLAWHIGDEHPAQGFGRALPAGTRAGAGPREGMLELVRRMRALATAAERSTAAGPLFDWYRSASALRDRLLTGTDRPAAAPAILDQCAHLFCNRLGVSVDVEQTLRRRAGQAVRSLTAEGS